MRALSPSALQSEMGQPWSRVENGQAPREMWRYHFTSGPGQSSRTCSAAMLCERFSTMIASYVRVVK